MTAQRKSNDSQRTQQTAEKKRVRKAATLVAEQASPEMVQLALEDPASASPAALLQLQRAQGNWAVQRLIARSAVSGSASTSTQRDSKKSPAADSGHLAHATAPQSAAALVTRTEAATITSPRASTRSIASQPAATPSPTVQRQTSTEPPAMAPKDKEQRLAKLQADALRLLEEQRGSTD